MLAAEQALDAKVHGLKGLAALTMISNKIAFAWLAGYLCLNLGMTVLNKALLQTYGWHHPETLALWHYTVTAVGSVFVVRVLGTIKPAKLDATVYPKLLAFSLLFNVNILMSNVSLNLVSMATHQVVRALVPGFTVAISFLWLGKSYSNKILQSLGVIFFGVCLYTSKGELTASSYGLLLTLLGAFLASLKGVVSNVFMVGPLKLHPLDLVHYMSSLAALQLLVYLSYTGELSKALADLEGVEHDGVLPLKLALTLNGCGAFFLNLASFNANRANTPLAINIAAILKQVLAIVFGIVVFGVHVSLVGVAGVCVTGIGITRYARESYRERAIASAVQGKPVQMNGGMNGDTDKSDKV